MLDYRSVRSASTSTGPSDALPLGRPDQKNRQVLSFPVAAWRWCKQGEHAEDATKCTVSAVLISAEAPASGRAGNSAVCRRGAQRQLGSNWEVIGDQG